MPPPRKADAASFTPCGDGFRGCIPLNATRTNFILLFCRFMSRRSLGVFVLIFSIKSRANVVIYRAAVASAAFILYKVCTRLRPVCKTKRAATNKLINTRQKDGKHMHQTCSVLYFVVCNTIQSTCARGVRLLLSCAYKVAANMSKDAAFIS